MKAIDIASGKFARTVIHALALLTSIATLHNPAQAADFCVLAGDAVGLQTALATASSNGGDNRIMLQAGSYDATNLLLNYVPTAAQHDIAISGGHYADDATNDPCGGLSSLNARDTVVHGGRLFMQLPPGAGSISMSGFTIAETFASTGGAPIEVDGGPNATGNLTIDRMIFEGHVSTNSVAVYLSTSGGALTIANSVFRQNSSFVNGNSAIVITNDRADTSFCTEIIQSTFTENFGTSAPGITLYETCSPIVANSVFWGNNSGQLDVFPTSTGFFLNDDLADLSEISSQLATDTFSLDPIFRPDSSISDLSPLREAGVIGSLFSNGANDVTGGPRIYGARPDIGAFELQDVIFAHPFDWQIPNP